MKGEGGSPYAITFNKFMTVIADRLEFHSQDCTASVELCSEVVIKASDLCDRKTSSCILCTQQDIEE